MKVWQVYIGRWWVAAPVAVAVASCALGYPVRLVDSWTGESEAPGE